MTRRASAATAALALLAAALGWIATPAAEAGAALTAAGPELARLLRLMALVKLGLAAGALALVAWRLGHPVGRARAAGYALACALMAAAPGPIWGLAHVAAGAALFHAGLVLLLVLGWGDDGARRAAVPHPWSLGRRERSLVPRPANLDQQGSRRTGAALASPSVSRRKRA